MKKAGAYIRRGRLVVFPTETVYGLGADAQNGEAVAAIFETKGRPHFNPLIVHLAEKEDARRIGIFNKAAERLAEGFWPGALSLVLPRREDCGLSDLVSAGLPTIALRVPAHETARSLIQEAGVPIAAPSANRSGRLSPTSAEMAASFLEGAEAVSMILDGGRTDLGLESTIIACLGKTPQLLREGALPREEIADILGVMPEDGRHEKINAPGQILRHYAPHAKLRLNARALEEGEVLLAFGKEIAGASVSRNLSRGRDMREAAANLFAALHALDKRAGETGSIAVMPIPEEGLGRAINDRLRRASYREEEKKVQS